MSRTFALLGAMAVVFSASVAGAALHCADLPAPIYVAGAAAAAPLLSSLAGPLANGASPGTLIYQEIPGCAAVEAVVRDGDPRTCAQGACLHGSATFYTLDGVRKSCDLDSAGTHAHVALSEVAPGSCPAFGGGNPKGIVDLSGPVVVHAFAADAAHSERALLAQEAHFVFGFGQKGGVAPWTNPASVLIRDERDGGQVLLGRYIQVPPGRFKGTVVAGSDDMILRLGGDPQSGIGFLPTALVDPRRLDVKALAFQALGQRGAFFPDARATTFEKQNVRDGHYPLWGYLHAVSLADPMTPTQAATREARQLAALLLGPATAEVDPAALHVRAGLVPVCAMRVMRDDDAAPMKSWQPAEPCGCWFDKTVKLGQTTCTACTDNTTCGAGHCRRGYCEVH